MEGTLEMPTLGRPFQVGMLYDCRSELLIPDTTLWEASTLQKEVTTEDQRQVKFQVIASESLQSKASALNLHGSLKASFFGGLFEVEGSAIYLREYKLSMSHACVTLHHSTTTELKHLPTKLLNRKSVSYKEAFEEGSATHVVTAVLYGAQTFFVFDCGASNSEEVQDIQGQLLEMIQKIPKVAAKGTGSIRWNDMEKEMEENISCRLYSDFPLESNPTAFQDALEIYANLPQILREGGKAVPVKAWLYPLIKLDPKAAHIMRDVPLSWLSEMETHLQSLIKADIRCSDLLRSPIASTFPEMKEKIKQLKHLCKQHGQIFQQEIGKNLPAVRGGKEDLAVLRDMSIRLNQIPFNRQALKKFLARKKQEMDFVELCLSHLKGLEVVSAQKLDKILFDRKNKFVISFVFTSLLSEEPYFCDLRGWLHRPCSEGRADPAVSSSEKQTSRLWFEDEGKKQNIRCAVASLLDFAEIHKEKGNVRFIVSAVCDESNPGASVYLYENGKLVNTRLELPSGPPPPEVEPIQPNSVRIRINPVAYGSALVSRYQVEYRIAGDEKWKSLPAEDPKNQFSLEDVQPDIEYQFRCAAVTHLGLSQWSKEIACICPRGKPAKKAHLEGEGERRTEVEEPYNLENEGYPGRHWHPYDDRFETPDQDVHHASHSALGRRRPQELELRIVLLGKTGAGKSATGNTILGRKCFMSEMGLLTVTERCQKEETLLNGRKVVVVDTPGFFDTQHSGLETATEVKKCVQLCLPGPHAIIHVIKVGIFSKEEKMTVQLIRKMFQNKAKPYTIILFTRKEDLEGESLEYFISTQDKELKKYIAECGYRCLAFNNKAKGVAREAQVATLIQMIDELVGKNKDAPYYSEEIQKESSWRSLF